ncbi:helix-turn-helix domain-containing protein [Actinoplanes sp. NEAU-A12]|uniref:Helix-turn-helix domain-containing protein n=1 Tax=Actinoplanes sandaracinus TaxID=3045177 RepID=A0ABT6X178_9ACTN|nr:TetR/AcrR family transcriptional regulator [Actinoplanes sandaracinus]MDI6105763.1 helix-turn-helix domain-containing protein [Actinoplanes sandaracinus]
MPRVSQDQLDARRHEILSAARNCFARFGYGGATVRRLEEATGMSRGAIFHHFRDKEHLFLAVAEDDAASMAETVARNGLVQVMRELLERAGTGESEGDTAGWLGTQLEVAHRRRTDPAFAKRWAQRSAAIADATRERLQRQRDAGVLREDVPVEVLTQFLELAYDGLVLHLATGRPAGELARVLDVVEAAVRKP